MGLEHETANTWASLIATPLQRSDSALPRGQRAAGRYRTASAAATTATGQRPAAMRQPLQRIVILCEPGLFADGLARSLRTLGSGVEVRVESSRGPADRFAQCALVIVDLEAGGDPQKAIDALRAKTTAPAVVLAHPDSSALLDAAMRAGAVALLPKSSTEAQMLEQIAGLLREQASTCDPDDRARKPGGKTPAAREVRPYGLTAGEMDVLRLLREGLTNAQIARERGSVHPSPRGSPQRANMVCGRPSWSSTLPTTKSTRSSRDCG
jgi:DNA-binding NarL/FixJ family response regulator